MSRPQLSIAIPLYNKADAIEETIKSCVSLCLATDIDFEVVVTNNCSTDFTSAEIDRLVAAYPSVRVVHLEATISLPDNWTYALNCCSGSLLTLRLADDPMPEFDLGRVLHLFFDTACDYAVGRTIPVFPANGFTTNYFDIVNQFRSGIASSIAFHDKVDHLMRHGLAGKAHNPFGDINALYFRRQHMSLLNRSIRACLPSLGTYPDLDIYLQLYLHCTGSFVDEVVSNFYYYDDSAPVVRAKGGAGPALYGYYDSTLPFYLLAHPSFESLLPALDLEQRREFFKRILINAREVLGDDALPSDLVRALQVEGKPQRRSPIFRRILRKLLPVWSRPST